MLFVGKYIQMMRLLKPIAFDVMTCMAQLFDFYMYSVSRISGAFKSKSQNQQVILSLLSGCTLVVLELAQHSCEVTPLIASQRIQELLLTLS